MTKKSACTVLRVPEIQARLRSCREELGALKKLLRMAKATQTIEAARVKRNKGAPAPLKDVPNDQPKTKGGHAREY
jgi:hypothetical protein